MKRFGNLRQVLFNTQKYFLLYISIFCRILQSQTNSNKTKRNRLNLHALYKMEIHVNTRETSLKLGGGNVVFNKNKNSVYYYVPSVRFLFYIFSYSTYSTYSRLLRRLNLYTKANFLFSILYFFSLFLSL